MKGKRIAKEKREEEKKGESQRALLRPFFSLHFSFPFLSLAHSIHITNQPVARKEVDDRRLVSRGEDIVIGVVMMTVWRGGHSPSSPSSLTKPTNRLGDEGRRLMHIVPAAAVRLMKSRV